MARTTKLIAAVVVSLLVAGGLTIAYFATVNPHSYDLPHTVPAAEPGEVVYATGKTLHISATSFPIEPAPETMALTQGGLYYLSDGILYLWSRNSSTKVADLGDGAGLATTADGRYLAFVDRMHGPFNLVGQRIAETVLFDTTTGVEVLRDATGNGDQTSTEDLDDLYPESPPTVLGFDDEALYAATAKGSTVYRWDLETGDRSSLDDGGFPSTPNRPGGAFLNFDMVKGVPLPSAAGAGGEYTGRLSPSAHHVVYTVGDGPLVFVLADDQPITELTFPIEKGTQFVVAGWLDEERFLGLGVRGPERGMPDGSAQMMTCSVSTVACSNVGDPVPATEKTLPVPPFGDFPY